MKKILTIIVTYNGMEWIDKCLSTLSESTIETEILVIDNDSSDDTVDFIKDNYPSIHIVESGENLGFGKANNIGLKRALEEAYDFVLLLNQDCYLDKDAIRKMMAHCDDDVGILTPIHLNAEGTNFDRNFFTFLRRYETYENNILKDFVFEKPRDYYDWGFINAACWFMPLKTIEHVGGFNPLFKHYGEDRDYCNRVRYHNLRIRVIPNTFVRHDRDNRLKNSNSKDICFRSALIDILDINISYSTISSVGNLLKTIKKSSSKHDDVLRLIRMRSDIEESRRLTIKKTPAFLK